MKNKKTIVTTLAVLGVLFITAGVSYAFFSYSREGTKKNTITTGALTFHYEEDSQGITITDGMPMTDNNGKAQTNYFAFNISSTTGSESKIPYEITVRRKGNDNSLDGAVKLYLTEVNNNTETALELATGNEVSKFSQLSTYTNAGLNIDASKNEKLLYQGEVPAGSNNYSKDYRLRMWLSNTAGDIAYNQTITGSCSDPTYTTREACTTAHEDWTDVATANQKEFSIIVNVYAKGETAQTSSRAGLYAANGTQTYTWQELIDNNYIAVNNGELTQGTDFSGLQMLVGELVIDDSVTSIGDWTFYGCSGLTSIEIPSSVTSIGGLAFSGTGLTSITIPSSVTSISGGAFEGIKVLNYTGTADDDTGDNWGARARNPYIEGDFAYNDNTKATLLVYLGNGGNVAIPSGVTSIGNYAFDGCSGLTSIIIPNSVTTIGEYAFGNNSNLTSVTFESGSQLTSIGGYAFDGTGLTDINIPSSVTSIGDAAFAYNMSLESVTFASNSQLTSIGNDAFYNCTNLTSIEIPSGVTSIGSDAFYGITLVSYSGSATGSPWGAGQVFSN